MSYIATLLLVFHKGLASTAQFKNKNKNVRAMRKIEKLYKKWDIEGKQAAK